jgi:FkbM family methyltransferase
MSLGSTISYIVNHPLNRGRRGAAVMRFAKWQIGSRLLEAPALLPMGVGGVLMARRGDTGATGNFYCGLHEYPDMLFLTHALRPGELFLDIGANIGAYSVLASTACKARVIACEPVEATCDRLRRNVGVNLVDDLVTVHRCAVGETVGTCTMTKSFDTTNHIVTGADSGGTERVDMRTLDSMVPSGETRVAKIDVEGFEMGVLRGGSRTLSDPGLRSVIIELNGAGARYGIKDEQIDEVLRGYGLTPCDYNPESRALTDLQRPHTEHNTIYIRKSSDIAEVLRSAAKVGVFGRMY